MITKKQIREMIIKYYQYETEYNLSNMSFDFISESYYETRNIKARERKLYFLMWYLSLETNLTFKLDSEHEIYEFYTLVKLSNNKKYFVLLEQDIDLPKTLNELVNLIYRLMLESLQIEVS